MNEQIKEMAQIMCSGCPYEDDCNYLCSYKDYAKKLYRAGYGNVNGYKAENEMLRTELRSKVDYIREQTEVIESMKASNKHFARNAVIKFAEKLKAKAFQGYQVGMYIVDTGIIDELLIEYGNEEN